MQANNAFESVGEASREPLARLSVDDFRLVVASTPLVSIDLLVRDSAGRYLLGYRNNAPARGSWFVPGGRIRKNESLAAAMERLQREELGADARLGPLRWRGVYEHFYADNFAGEAGASTHYVVLAYEAALQGQAPRLPDSQHSAYRWLLPAEILEDSAVHPYSRAYFTG